MPHLSAERLAALADTGTLADAYEQEHLAHCSECASERHAYEALVRGARAQRRTISTPLTGWDGIAAGLRAEGLIRSGGDAATRGAAGVAGDAGGKGPSRARPHGRSLARSAWLRAAAAVALLAGGVAAGRASAVAGPLAIPSPVPAATVASDSDPFTGGVAWPVENLIPDYRSPAEAAAALQRFEVAYQHAAAYLAGSDTSGRLDGTEDYRTRLVALDRAGRTMREAMEKAPYDPVLTGYYLTTLGQREATLRQLNVAVPAGARLNSF